MDVEAAYFGETTLGKVPRIKRAVDAWYPYPRKARSGSDMVLPHPHHIDVTRCHISSYTLLATSL